MNLKQFLIFLFILTNTYSVMGQSDILIKSSTPLSIGEQIKFQSIILGEDRVLNVYLPNGYHKDSSKKYPVIYLLDGSIDEDFIHISGLVQFGSFSWINMIPESIVVGISNVDRKRDFTFSATNEEYKKDFPTTGGSKKFIQFIEEELQPLINNTYNVSTEKTLLGQSLGGLLATEILFKKPDLFENYIIVSPSLWWDDELLLKENPAQYSKPKSIYVAVGKEGPVMQRTAKELYKKLKKENDTDSNIYFKFYKEQNHGDALHLATYDAFKTIFEPEKK